MQNDPRKGDGWDTFLEDQDPIWEEAFETTKNGYINVDAYDEFDNIQDIVNFVTGLGKYENTRSFQPGQQDLEDKKTELQNDQWEVPGKLEKMRRYLEQGADITEIDLDPSATEHLTISQEEAKPRDKNTKYTAHFVAYNKSAEQPDAYFYIETSWYDEKPVDMNLEDAFDIEQISENIKNME